MSEADRIRLGHMLSSVEEALRFCRGRARADMDSDRMLVLSVIKCLEILGEAASKATAEARAKLPRVPWTDIVLMRNRLIHGYFDIDLDIVWKTVTEDLPSLELELKQAQASL